MTAPAVVMSGHAPIGAEVLTRDEALALADYEQTIERGIRTYIEVGTALGQIREQRLYRALAATFEDYCHSRWGFNRHRAAQLIGALDVVTTVTSEGLPAPANEGQARALGQVPRERQAEVWREVTETEGKVTAEKIRDVADARKPDLAPTILEALASAGRDGLDQKVIAATWPDPPAEKDLLRALEKLTKSGEIVVTRTWANGKARKWAASAALGDLTPEIERALTQYGATGATGWQVAFLIDQAGADALVGSVLSALRDLLDGGEVSVVGERDGLTVWALTKLIAAEAPDPVAGSGLTYPAPDVAAKPQPISAPSGSARLEDDLAADSKRRAAIRNLTSALTFLNPVAIAPTDLARREYAPVLDEFALEDLERAAETLSTLISLKRGT